MICYSTDAQTANLIAREDTQVSYDRPLISDIILMIREREKKVSLWYQAGLIDFSLTSVANAIALCPNCHLWIDHLDDPLLVFIPADLQFFIDFELDDQEKRKSAAREKGVLLPRTVPTSTMYKEHLLQQGKISEEAVGGLYRPLYLKRQLFGGLCSVEEVGLTKPKPWHGAPMATLRRGILALGSARIGSVDPKIVSQLQLLRDLYFHFQAHEDHSTGLGKRKIESRTKRQTEHDDDHDESNKRAKTADSSLKDESRNTKGNCLDVQTQSLTDCQFPQEECVLGPQFTTEEIVQRYKDFVSQ